MKRSEFLKKLGLGALAVTVAPCIILESNNKSVVLKEKVSVKKQREILDLLVDNNELLYIPLAGSGLKEYDVVLGESGFRYKVSHKDGDFWVCKQLMTKHAHWQTWTKTVPYRKNRKNIVQTKDTSGYYG